MQQLMISLMSLRETGQCGEFKQVERNGHVSSSLLVSFHRVYIPCIYVLNKIDQISIEVGISCPYHFQIYICTLTSSLLLSRFLSSSSHYTRQELDIIYKIPHTVPISAHHKWNFDDLLEKMWEYLNLVRM